MEGESMSEWKEVRLGDVILHSCSGGTPKSNVSEYYDGEIPWLNTKEIDFNRIYQTERNITQKGLDNSSAKWIDEKCVIIAMYGATAGKIAINMIPLTTNQACCNLKVDDRLADFRYIYYFLKKDFKFLASLANGGAQQNLNSQIIKDYVIKLPSLSIQKEISDLLWTIDAKIETNNKLNEKLEEMAQAIFKSWFVDFEPFKDKPFHETELGMIPEGWEVHAASDMYNINIGKTPPRKEPIWFSENQNDVKWVSISDLGKSGAFIIDSSEKLTKEAINKYNIIVVPKNTILLSFKLTIGRVAICNSDMTTNEAIARFYLNDEFDMEYLYMYLKNYNYELLGSTSSIATAVNSKIIKNMYILKPPFEVVKRFHSIVNPLFERIRRNIEENKRLASLRDTLLPRLMSGELKV